MGHDGFIPAGGKPGCEDILPRRGGILAQPIEAPADSEEPTPLTGMVR